MNAHDLHADRRALTQREQEVLRAIVVQYLQTGEPVGSRTVAKGNSEGLCSASIRGIMSELEEGGFISHPHASAGRLPTDTGLRHYVETLDSRPRLSGAEKRALADNLYAEGGLPSLLARCTHLLSVASQQISVGTAHDLGATVFRHVELIKLTEERLLVVFITAAGIVSQHVMVLRVPESQAELDRHARYLNEQLAGQNLSQVRGRLAELVQEERAACDALARRALELGARYFASGQGSTGELVVQGTERVLDRPDPADLDRLKSLLAALEDKQRILNLLNRFLDRDGVALAIGRENEDPDLAGCSVVAASYGHGDTKLGALGIIGPTRMRYDRAIALVEYVADLLGAALQGSRS